MLRADATEEQLLSELRPLLAALSPGDRFGPFRLQEPLRIGYNRALSLCRVLVAEGVLSPTEDGKFEVSA